MASLCVEIDSNGYVITNGLSESECVSFVLVDASTYQLAITPTLNTADIQTMFVWGFGAVLSAYVAGYGVGVLKRLISKM